MSATTWTVAEAKAKFSEVIEWGTVARSADDHAAMVKRPWVIVAAEEWERKTKRTGNLAEFFAASPLRGSGVKARRIKDRPRRIDL